jgi:uncharacterized phage protein (TIGR01671 family)
MKEIKFRAWNTQEKKMLFRRLFEMNWYETPTNDEKGCHTWGAISGGQSRFLEVMQYTGLKDKNGKEIYEGDVVNFEGITNYEIKFIRGGFAVDFKDGHRYLGQFANPEIIGNIYENPELLPQSKPVV